MMVSKGHAAASAMMIWEVCTVIWGHGVIQAKAAAVSHVRVLGPNTARVCDDVPDSWYLAIAALGAMLNWVTYAVT